MTDLKKELLDLIEEVGNSWTEEEKNLARQVAEDYADLTMERMTGKPDSVAVAHAKAAAASLLVGGAATLAEVLVERIRQFTANLVSDLVPGM